MAGRVGRTEFVVMMAATMALTALSIDLMLPAFDEMRADFGLASDSTNIAATITVFFIGLAIAQLFYGPLADRFGRKPVLYGGLLIFVLGRSARRWPVRSASCWRSASSGVSVRRRRG